MCDALHLQKFQIPPGALDEPAIVDASVRRVIDERKRSKDDVEKKKKDDAERGVRGRGSRAHGGPARGQGRGSSDGPVRARGRGRGAPSMPGELTLDFSASNV